MFDYKPYTYLVKNNTTGFFYYGCKYSRNGYTHPDLFWNTKHRKGYFTSSKTVHKLIELYGVEDFTVEIRKVFNNPIETLEFEKRVISKIMNWPNCINANCGGVYDCNKPRRLKINGVSSYDRQGQLWIDWCKSINPETGNTNSYDRADSQRGVKKSADHIKSIQQSRLVVGDDGLNVNQRAALKRMGSNNKSTTDEVKAKISKTVKLYRSTLTDEDLKIRSDKIKSGMLNSDKCKRMIENNKNNPINKGKVWYNNGSDNFRLDPSDPIISNQNLVKGRLSFGMVRSEHTCPHCGKVGKGPNMKRYHFDKCKEKK